MDALPLGLIFATTNEVVFSKVNLVNALKLKAEGGRGCDPIKQKNQLCLQFVRIYDCNHEESLSCRNRGRYWDFSPRNLVNFSVEGPLKMVQM